MQLDRRYSSYLSSIPMYGFQDNEAKQSNFVLKGNSFYQKESSDNFDENRN